MKILFVIPNLGKGGAEDLIVNLSSRLSVNPDNEVSILVFQRLFEDRYNISRTNCQVKIVSLFPIMFSSTAKLTRLIRIVLYVFAPIVAGLIFICFKLWNYDIIHINLMLSSVCAPWWVLLSRIIPGKRPIFIETFHTNWHLLRWFQKLVFRISWSAVDKVICEIRDTEIGIVKRKSFARDVYFIPVGVSKPEGKDDQFQKKFIEHHFGSFWSGANNKIVIMTIASLNNFKKRFDCILEALSYMKRQGFSDFEYWICGDGPDRKLIERFVEMLDLSDQVKILGFIDHPQQVVYLADIFIVAMVGEYAGIAGLQAGVAGIPVIGVQTVPGYVGKDDAIWSSENPEDIAQKIVELRDRSVRQQYALSAQTYIEREHDIERFYAEYQRLFDACTVR